MRKKILTLLSLAALSLNIPAGAQELASLPKGSEYTTGTLPNGIEYYLVTNKTVTGKADFAIAQQGQPDRFLSRRVLSYARHFGNRHPYDFLANNGIGYDRSGYISYRDDATVFDFKNAPVTEQSVCDSLMLLMFDIAATHQGGQAFVVSGDINANAMAERFKLLSIVLAQRDSVNRKDNYVWMPQDNTTYYYTSRQADNLAALRISYSSARVPMDRMNTFQPSVIKMYSSWFGTILARRIRDDFFKSGIPLGDIMYRYYDSSMGKGDEQYTMTLITSPEQYTAAVSHIAAILADLDTRGVTVKELQDAKNKLMATALKEGNNSIKTNENYVKRCISAFLYGANLASDGTINNFFSRSAISNEKEVDFFNKFIFAVIDKSKNLTIGFDEPISTTADLPALFTKEWEKSESDSTMTFTIKPDTPKLYIPSVKTKIRQESKEPISGGSLWTFANGTKVIYKKTAVKGMFSYALMLRGGCTDVSGLKPGENAFISDMMALSTIGGVPGVHFMDSMADNGITMDTEVSLSDMRIQGSAPTERLDVLLISLLTVAYNRQPDPKAFDYYKTCIGLSTKQERKTRDGLDAMLDSLISPKYCYLDSKDVKALQDDLPERAEAFFEQQFGKCSDGLLVLMGDLDEENLKKQLCNYMGDFVTGKKLAVRPKVNREATVGTTTYTMEAAKCPAGPGDICLALAYNAPVVFNMTNFMALRIAMLALQDKLAVALCPMGAASTVSGTFELFPEERADIHIDCTPCTGIGLPEGIENQGTLHILHAIRSIIEEMAVKGIPEKDLARYRNIVVNSYGANMDTDAGLVDAILVRYSEGRDVRTGFKESAEGVKTDNIIQVMTAIRNGGCAEMVLL